MDPKNIPKTPSQEVFGRLGIYVELWIILLINCDFGSTFPILSHINFGLLNSYNIHTYIYIYVHVYTVYIYNHIHADAQCMAYLPTFG